MDGPEEATEGMSAEEIEEVGIRNAMMQGHIHCGIETRLLYLILKELRGLRKLLIETSIRA